MAKKQGIVPQITFKSLLDPITDIEKRNKKFASLSDEGKRLEIAWEALKLVVGGIAEPSNVIDSKTGKRSYYRYWDENLVTIYRGSKSSKDLQEALLDVKSCTVCERGILTLAKIRIGNNVNPSKIWVSRACDGYSTCAREGFSINSFGSMETEYELSYYKHPYNSNTSKKMANILCNVLVNGDFNTEDKTDYLTLKL